MAVDINDLNEDQFVTKRRDVGDCCQRTTSDLGGGVKIGFTGRPNAHLGAVEDDEEYTNMRDFYGFMLPEHYRKM